MTECPKCGEGKITAPKYEKATAAGFYAETLKYTCMNCGYSVRTPCKDAAK